MKRLLASLAVLFAASAHGQEICYEIQGTGPYSGIHSGTGSEFCSAVIDMLGPPHSLGGCTGMTGTPTGPSQNVTADIFYSGSHVAYAVGNSVPLPACPPPPPECDKEGQSEQIVSASPLGGASYCQGVCKATAGSSVCGGPAGGPMSCATTVSWTTDMSCSTSEPPSPPMPPDAEGEGPEDGVPPESCTSVGDGEYCKSGAGDGDCGYMNDTFICLGNVKENECRALGDGGRVCGPGANTTPPVPDNGTPGQMAEPDGQLTETPSSGPNAGTTIIYNYFSSGTVGGSARDPGADGAASNGGSPNGGGNGDGEGDGEGSCVGETCGEGVPTLADVGTMSEAFTGFWEDLQEVPVVSAAATVAPAFGSGSCPSWADSFSLFGQTISMDFSFICTTWDNVAPVVSIVALVLWGLLAFRVLFSA